MVLFKTKSDQNNTSIYKISYFLFRVLSKFTPKLFNCSMFSKISPGAKHNIYSKRVV